MNKRAFFQWTVLVVAGTAFLYVASLGPVFAYLMHTGRQEFYFSKVYTVYRPLILLSQEYPTVEKCLLFYCDIWQKFLPEAKKAEPE